MVDQIVVDSFKFKILDLGRVFKLVAKRLVAFSEYLGCTPGSTASLQLPTNTDSGNQG